MGCSGSSLKDLAIDPDLDLNLDEPYAKEKLQAAQQRRLSFDSNASTLVSEGGIKDNEEGKRGNISKFQIWLEGKWANYCEEEDAVLKRAFLVGHSHARYHLRGQHYEYNFEAMKQINLGTRKERRIRAPRFMRPPREPLLPPGSMVVVTVPAGAAGGTMKIDDPNNVGETLEVLVPAGASAGAAMAVPVPRRGETAADVRRRQENFSTGTVAATGAGAAGAFVLGGAILGDHLTGGGAGEWAEGRAAGDAAAWVEGAAEDACEWLHGAAEDADEWVDCAAEDVADWLACSADDVGDFVMDLF